MKIYIEAFSQEKEKKLLERDTDFSGRTGISERVVGLARETEGMDRNDH